MTLQEIQPHQVHNVAMQQQTTNQAEEAVAWLKPAVQQSMYNMAQSLAKASLVPQQFRGKADDIYFTLMMAMEMKLPPITALNNMYVVGGRPAMYTSLAISLANQRGPFATPINWRVTGEGDHMMVTAYAKLRTTGEIAQATVSMAMAKAENWTKNSKYRTMPDHMLKYRAASMLIRTVCPEVLTGLQTVEEAETTEVETSDPVPSPDATTIKELNASREDDKHHDLVNDIQQEFARLYKMGKTNEDIAGILGVDLTSIRDKKVDELEMILSVLAEVKE